jgi:uncharacterized damage-inducible protein DinB
LSRVWRPNMMKIDKEFLSLQLEYTRWASERSLDAARPLNEEELARDLSNSHGGVLGTLVHIYQSDRVWLSRLQGSPRLKLHDPDEYWTLDTLGAAWEKTAAGFCEWIAEVQDVEKILQYKNQAGQAYALPIWQVILHVVNHATYHRGQITTMLRQLGYTPVATDLHVFYLSRRPD